METFEVESSPGVYKTVLDVRQVRRVPSASSVTMGLSGDDGTAYPAL